MNLRRDDVFAATAADSAMVVPVMALINTLALFSPNTTLVVLSVKLTEAEVFRLCQFATRLGLRLRMLTFNSDIVQHTVLRSPHLSRVAYARLFLPELLPDLERVIWLDTDTLVLENLTSLWQIEMEDSLVAAVPDDFIQKEEISDTGSQLGQYFNSGVMVMNLGLWRTENLMSRVWDLISSPNLIYEDQSVVNMICLNRVHLLNRKWNFFTRRFSCSCDFFNAR